MIMNCLWVLNVCQHWAKCLPSITQCGHFSKHFVKHNYFPILNGVENLANNTQVQHGWNGIDFQVQLTEK